MSKLLLIILSAFFLSGCTLKNLFIKQPSGLEITTSSQATVYLGETELGTTPLKKTDIKPGNYTLRLLPSDSSLAPYETSVTLEPSASTVITRTFGPTLLDSFGYNLTLIPDQSGLATLSVVSDPDTANLTIDGIPSGFTPVSKRELSPGNHELTVGTPGYSEQKIPISAAAGYNLLINLKLKAEPITLTPATAATSASTLTTVPAASSTPLPSASPELSSTPALTLLPPYVTVLDSPDVRSAGGLNVRKSDSSSSDSLGKADIGEKLKYLGETSAAGWHKIEFEGSVGYVSAKYATLTR